MTSQKTIKRGALVEAFTDTVPTLPEEHVLIHAGKLYETRHYDGDVDTDGVAEVYVETSKTRHLLHMLFTFSASLAAEFEIFEDTDKAYVSDNALTSYNRNRDSSHPLAGTTKICHTPSGSGDGTSIFKGLVGGGTKQGSLGGIGRDANELLLKGGTKYLLRITSKADNNRCMIFAEYYERWHPTAQTTTTSTTTTTTTTA